MSEVLEKLISDRLTLILARNSIPNHQFDFPQQRDTSEQIHRVTEVVNQATGEKYCSSDFLDVTQAFDEV